MVTSRRINHQIEQIRSHFGLIDSNETTKIILRPNSNKRNDKKIYLQINDTFQKDLMFIKKELIYFKKI